MSKSDDLIYKQDSIDAINRCMEIYINNLQTMIYKIDAYKALTDLPSVQQEIIRCKDCKYGSPNGKYGCKVYHYKKYETHEMEPDDFCSKAERKNDELGDS